MDWTFSNRYSEGPEEFEDPPAWGANTPSFVRCHTTLCAHVQSTSSACVRPSSASLSDGCCHCQSSSSSVVCTWSTTSSFQRRARAAGKAATGLGAPSPPPYAASSSLTVSNGNGSLARAVRIFEYL